MRSRTTLLVALAVLAAAFSAGSASATGPRARTLAFSAGRIAAFAQDGARIAWAAVEPDGEPCPWLVRVRNLATRRQVGINGADGPTCRTDVGFQEPVQLALAGPRALWTTHGAGNFTYVQVYGATVAGRSDTQLTELVYSNALEEGDHLGGLAGDGGTLVYGWYGLDVIVEGTCEEDGTCRLRAAAGGVATSDGGTAAPLAGAGPAGLIAAARGRVAVVPPERAGLGAPPESGARPVEVRRASDGRLVGRIVPAGTVRAVALTRRTLVVLVDAGSGRRIERYPTAGGPPLDTMPVPRGTAPELSATDATVVFRVGRSVWALDTGDGTATLVARAARQPIGLSIEGARVAWAENVGAGGRIRAVSLG